MTDLYFEDTEIGAISKAGPYLVSKEEIIRFATQYDPVPRHLDEEAAALTIFGGLTASASHTFAIYRSLTPKLQPRLHGLAGLGWDELRVPNPVRPGDKLDLEAIVLEKRESKSKPDRGIVTVETKAFNQDGKEVCYFRRRVMVWKRDSVPARRRPRGGRTGDPLGAHHRAGRPHPLPAGRGGDPDDGGLAGRRRDERPVRRERVVRRDQRRENGEQRECQRRPQAGRARHAAKGVAAAGEILGADEDSVHDQQQTERADHRRRPGPGARAGRTRGDRPGRRGRRDSGRPRTTPENDWCPLQG